MHFANSFDCIQAIKLESTAIEGWGKVIIAGKIFVLNLILSRSAWPICHVRGLIDSIPNIQPMFRVFRVAFGRMKLCFLLVPRVLRIRIYAFSLERLLNNFTFY